MQFIQPDARQLKANLHSHSTLSDGRLTPEELIRAYREAGYSVLAITDHEATYDHSALSTDELLLLTGYEAYIRPSPECVIDLFGPEVHLNLLAKDRHNVTFVDYDPKFCKYMPHEVADTRPKAGALGPRQYTRAYIQQFIDDARAAGYLVTYNHPVWSMEAQEDILSYDGYFSLEIFNTGSMVINGGEYNLALYDRLLRHGKFPFCHGADDNHNKSPFGHPLCDSFGAWTMILADSTDYDAVIGALERGDFYASTGPAITSLCVEGNRASLTCSAARRIVMHVSPKRAYSVCREDASPVTEAEFTIPDFAPYVYFSVFAENGTSAHTRAFRREEFA